MNQNQNQNQNEQATPAISPEILTRIKALEEICNFFLLREDEGITPGEVALVERIDAIANNPGLYTATDAQKAIAEALDLLDYYSLDNGKEVALLSNLFEIAEGAKPETILAAIPSFIRNTGPAPKTTTPPGLLFDAYELKEVACINGEDCEPIETAEDREHAEETGAAIFWTIYGHYAPESGREGVEALIDNTDEKAAREIYDHLTRALDALKARS